MTGSGDRAVYDSHETGYIELIGNAKLTRDGNTVTGNKLRITNLSGSDSRMQVNGNVCIVYYPQTAAEKNAPGNEKKFARGKDEDTVQKATSHTEDKKA